MGPVDRDVASERPGRLVRKDPTAAVLLEVVLGTFLGTFGIGHLYVGNVVVGVLIMVSYWFLLGVNLCLLGVLVGVVTLPLTWMLYVLLSPIWAHRAAVVYNRGVDRSLRGDDSTW